MYLNFFGSGVFIRIESPLGSLEARYLLAKSVLVMLTTTSVKVGAYSGPLDPLKPAIMVN